MSNNLFLKYNTYFLGALKIIGSIIIFSSGIYTIQYDESSSQLPVAVCLFLLLAMIILHNRILNYLFKPIIELLRNDDEIDFNNFKKLKRNSIINSIILFVLFFLPTYLMILFIVVPQWVYLINLKNKSKNLIEDL